MRKSFFIILILLLASPCLADVSSYVQKMSQNEQQMLKQNLNQAFLYDADDSDTQNSDDFYNEMIYQKYGSNDSPGFNNSLEMNPNEADYAYHTN